MTDLEQAQQDGIAPWTNLVWEDFHVAVFKDQFPVTDGHLLFVPKYNTPTVILDAFESAMLEGKHMREDGKCDGFNVGINMGAAAGQTVMYPHVHLIPRRVGDVADPVGGVRGVVPGQANYRNDNYKLPK